MLQLNVLLADDMLHERLVIETRLREAVGKEINLIFTSVETAEDAVAKAASELYPLVILDVDFSQSARSRGMDGLAASKTIKAKNPSVYTVVVSSKEDVATMLTAIENFDVDWYLRRSSISYDELAWLCKRAVFSKMHEDGLLIEEKYRFFTNSPAAKKVLRTADSVLSTQNVLIYGETGTGKELISRRLHANAKLFQAKRPFRILDCASLPESLFEGEVFGYRKGAFTGAVTDRAGAIQLAHGGDLFLDEIQNIPIAVQQKLLRVLNDGVFSPLGSNEELKSNFRIIAATNIPVERSIQDGKLLADFVARIQKINLNLVPLRDRPQDIRLLASHTLEGVGFFDKEFSEDALNYLEALPWRGNIRELKSVVEMAAQAVKIPVINIKDIEAIVTRGASCSVHRNSDFLSSVADRLIKEDVPLSRAVQEIEDYYLSTQFKAKPNVQALANVSGYNRNTLTKRLRALGIKS